MTETQDNWLGRRVLVTGATGMVGSALSARLVQEGAVVVAVVQDVDPLTELYRSGTVNHVSIVNGRLEDPAVVERAVVGHEVEVVFHLGAQTIVSTAYRSPRATLESNVQGTWNVLEAARLHPDLVRAVVVASSDKAYGESPELPYVETMKLQGTHPYEVSKSMTDLVSRSYALSYGVPAVVARCGNIYGPGDLNWSRIVPGTFRAILLNEQPVLRSDGTFLRDYLCLDDVVEAYLALSANAATQAGEAFNFSDEAPISVLEIYRACCVAAGQPDLSPRILSKATGEIKDQYLDASKARELLGWSAKTSLSAGLAETFTWYERFLASS